MRTIRLAWRNFVRNRSRYRILAIAFVIAMTALVVASGLLIGLTQTIRTKASLYFAGHVAVQSYRDRNAVSEIPDPDEVVEIVESIPGRRHQVVLRSIYYRGDATLFFAGNYINQRRLIGVDWDPERDALESLNIVSGRVPSAEDRAGAIVSSTTANELGATVGDQVTVSLRTRRGHLNTADFIIAAIYEESSFFGYVTYLNRMTFNELYGHAPDAASDVGVYLDRPGREMAVAQHIQERLDGEAGFAFPVFRSRSARDSALSGAWEGTRYAVVTLGAQLAEIEELIAAVTVVAVLVVLVFVAIAVAGVSNTFSMLVFERTAEIGTLRALGLTREATLAMFVSEACLLGLSSTLAGVATGFAVLSVVGSSVVISGQRLISLFLVGGRLAWTVPLEVVVAVLALGIVSSAIGSLRPAIKASAMRPVEALRAA